MSTRQTDAVAHDRPNARNQSTTKRYDLQRPGGALRESEDAESRFKRLIGTSNDHQTQMHDGTADKQTNHDEERQENDHCSGPNSHASHRGKAVVVPIGEE